MSQPRSELFFCICVLQRLGGLGLANLEMDEYGELPPLARAKRCRALAEHARRAAGKVNGSIRESYLMLADQWERLAVEAEKRAAEPPT